MNSHISVYLLIALLPLASAWENCTPGITDCRFGECACANGGVCAGTNFTVCVCPRPDQFDGPYCEYPQCTGADFLNGCGPGWCTYPGRCNCDGTGFTGLDCSIPICKVDESSCLNGGLCNTSNGRCDCSGTGYQGEVCQDDINECNQSPSPCATSCVNIPGGFSCSPCPQGTVGTPYLVHDAAGVFISGGCVLATSDLSSSQQISEDLTGSSSLSTPVGSSSALAPAESVPSSGLIPSDTAVLASTGLIPTTEVSFTRVTIVGPNTNSITEGSDTTEATSGNGNTISTSAGDGQSQSRASDGTSTSIAGSQDSDPSQTVSGLVPLDQFPSGVVTDSQVEAFSSGTTVSISIIIATATLMLVM